MRTRTPLLPACVVCISLSITSHAFAQQSRPVLPTSASQKEVTLPYDAPAIYSYKTYSAPNNMFGYDILKNGKPLYHQFVLTALTNEGKRIYATKLQSEKLATIAIEKVKNGQPPAFTNEELLQILSH
jgi:hypothetical protein